MEEKAEVKRESLLDLDDLLQCPVCYEIPTGQIFQCNEGHHVCGPCKMRLDVCPVCRALFFGTRNYAMEELISNFRKIQKLKLSVKTSDGSGSSTSSTPAKETAPAETEREINANDDDDNSTNVSERPLGPPQPCSGLFRCLCCKTGKSARLPAARLLNHLRYFHARDLLEGHSENGEYLQAWQFSTVPGKFVTAVRISDMGIFFLTIEITDNCVCAWLSIAASPWIAHEFTYTITICGNDREAIFTDLVYSVRSCEGSLRKRGHCLIAKDSDARALTAPTAISGKLSVRRTPRDTDVSQTQPRAVLRIANRVSGGAPRGLAPFLQDLQDDVERLSRAFATLDRQTDALIHSGNQRRTSESADGRTAHRNANGGDPANDRDNRPVRPIRDVQRLEAIPIIDPSTGELVSVTRPTNRAPRADIRDAPRRVAIPIVDPSTGNTVTATRESEPRVNEAHLLSLGHNRSLIARIGDQYVAPGHRAHVTLESNMAGNRNSPNWEEINIAVSRAPTSPRTDITLDLPEAAGVSSNPQTSNGQLSRQARRRRRTRMRAALNRPIPPETTANHPVQPPPVTSPRTNGYVLRYP